MLSLYIITIAFVLQIKKLRFREVRQLSLSHTASDRIRAQNPGLLWSEIGSLPIRHASGRELRSISFQALILWTSTGGSEKSDVPRVSLVQAFSDPTAFPLCHLMSESSSFSDSGWWLPPVFLTEFASPELAVSAGAGSIVSEIKRKKKQTGMWHTEGKQV